MVTVRLRLKSKSYSVGRPGPDSRILVIETRDPRIRSFLIMTEPSAVHDSWIICTGEARYRRVFFFATHVTHISIVLRCVTSTVVLYVKIMSFLRSSLNMIIECVDGLQV